MPWSTARRGTVEFRGFAAVFSVAFLASIGSLIFYRPITSPNTIDKSPDFNFIDFLKETKRGHLGTFIMYVSMVNFTVYLCSPLFAIYMLNDLHFSYLTFTGLICVEYLARVASLTLWGRHVDRASALRVMGIASYMVPVIPILWLFSSNVIYLAGVQIISGSAWAIFELCSQSFIFRASPQNLKMKYVIYHKSLSTLFVSLGALGGAYLINIVFPVFGSKILGLFLVSGVLRLLVVRYMLPKLRDTTLPFKPDQTAPNLNVFFETWVPKYSLYYNLQDFGAMLPVPAVVEPGREQNQRALFYQPSDTANYNHEVTPIKNINKQAIYRQGFEPIPVGLEEVQELQPAATINKQALFYEPQLLMNIQPDPVEKIILYQWH